MFMSLIRVAADSGLEIEISLRFLHSTPLFCSFFYCATNKASGIWMYFKFVATVGTALWFGTIERLS